MRAYLHVGMPKAGSTAIQLSLAAHEPELLKDYGIYYGPLDQRFQNDYDIFCAHLAGQKGLLRDLLLKKRQNAYALNATKIIFSCERFFEIAENPNEFSEFVQHFAEIFDNSVEFIVVYRDLRSFIKSHATQLIYNGGITYNNMGLASWVARLLEAYHDLPFKVSFINFNVAKNESRLYGNFLELISDRPCHENERFENITPARPLAYAAILGQICKVESVLQGKDINSREIDLLRSSINEKFDILWTCGPEQSEEKHMMTYLSRLMEECISRYIDGSIQRLDDPRRLFLEKLESSNIITNNCVP
jgi:hypothetical protein